MVQRIVIVTGTSTGLGLSTAVQLAKDAQKAFKVYACMRNLAKKDDLTQRAAESVDQTLFFLQMDVCSETSVLTAVKHVLDKEGTIDVLINNAGVGLMGPLECCNWDDIMNTFNTNVHGIIRTIQAVVPTMKKQKKGHIINVSSIAGLVGFPFNGVYGATKFAVEGLSECLAPELAQFNINVSVIEPGPITTPFVAATKSKLKQETGDEQTKEMMGKVIQTILSTWFVDGVQQTPDEVAEWIVKAVKAAKPHLRYITNNAFEDLCKKKNDDMTGDAVVKSAIETFLGSSTK